MKRTRKKKGIFISIAVILVLWLIMGTIDCIKVIHRFEKPIFCLLNAETGYDDGGSGTYKGLGYSFDIMGNFMPEAEYPGVTRYTYYVFGSEVSSGIRD